MGIRVARAVTPAVTLVVTLSGVLAVAACAVPVRGAPAADPAALARPAPAPRPPGEVFRDSQGRFDLVPPPGWTVDTTGRQSTAVVFADPRPSESPSGRFRANINVLVLAARTDLAGTVTMARQEVQELADYRSTADEPVTLPDGSPAHLIGGTFRDPESGLVLRNVQLLAVHGPQTVVATGTALVDTWGAHGPVFETSLRSLTVAT